MRIVFLGTPAFAVPCLEMLIREGHTVALVVTQPDRPAGRGNRICSPPVKSTALEYGIRIIQPLKIKDEAFWNILKENEPDLIVTVAFGRILPNTVLRIPKFGCVNVHASLLPKYRGAAPINWAIINGETETGITTMFMDEGMDTGDIILTSRTPIGRDMTAGELHDVLMAIGADLLRQTCTLIQRGDAPRIPQDDSKAVNAPLLKADIGRIDWSRSASEVHNLVRGLSPVIGAYTYYNGERMRIWKTSVFDEHVCIDGGPGSKFGCLESVSRKGVLVRCGESCVNLLQIQFDSARKMDISECWHRMHPGECFLDGGVRE